MATSTSSSSSSPSPLPLPGLGPETEDVRPVPARFRKRRNRFVAEVALADGSETTAYLPNTARLKDLLTDAVEVLLEPSDDRKRSTDWTLTRVRARGRWVSLEASGANDLLAGYLEHGGELAGIGRVTELEREVRHGSHRFDLRGRTEDGDTVWIEVKSLSRTDEDGAARLSMTPSTRATAHLASLGEIVAAGERAAVVFVVQRSDADRLDLEGDAEEGWQDAVTAARAAGVHVAAVGCEVSARGAVVTEPLPVTPSAPTRRSA